MRGASLELNIAGKVIYCFPVLKTEDPMSGTLLMERSWEHMSDMMVLYGPLIVTG